MHDETLIRISERIVEARQRVRDAKRELNYAQAHLGREITRLQDHLGTIRYHADYPREREETGHSAPMPPRTLEDWAT